MPIKINGATSGSTTITAPATGGDESIELSTALAAKLDTPGAWTSYTPVLTADTTSPTLGTGGTAVGAYTQIGKTVFYNFRFTFGSSGVAAGSGLYRVSVPVVPAYTVGGSVAGSTLYMFDNSAATMWNAGFMQLSAGSIAYISYGAGTANQGVGAALPWTWAASDRLWGSMIYEAA